MTLTLKAPSILLVVCFISYLHALPHNRHLLHISAPSTSNNVPSSSNKLTNQNPFFDPSHQAVNNDVLHKPQEIHADDEVDDGLDAMKVLDVDLDDITVAPDLKEALPDISPDAMQPTPMPDPHDALVDNQMNHLVPGTTEEREGDTMGPVQQSLASALNNDIKNLFKTYEASLYATVKTLYEDYNLKGESVATTIAPQTQSPSEGQIGVGQKSRPKINEKSSPTALQSFFAKYDFEVDADVIQDKLFAAYNSIAAGPHDENQHDEPVTSHFHPTKTPPFSTPKVNADELCDTTHDPREIFRNIDFGTVYKKEDEEEVEVKKEDKEENKEENKDVEEEASEMPETDVILSAIQDDIEEKENSTTQEPFVAYFTDEEKETYDSETIEEFYDRFISMKGAIIQPVLVS